MLYWQKISSQTKFQNDHWSYKIDEFQLENGERGVYHYVHTFGSSMVIPVTSDGKILLVKQYRYLNERESIEFPCGGMNEGISYKENAIKELREETGFSAGTILEIGEFAPFTGAADEISKVFLAKDLFSSPLPKDATEEFILMEKTPKEIEELISKNIIWDGLTLAAWSLARRHFQNEL
ncbi:MAG: NUDIX hydrolase [Ignavibacteriaceae bacterium]|nr:NUDIX hydrolase [Ignavibacteriaceae bacterium]